MTERRLSFRCDVPVGVSDQQVDPDGREQRDVTVTWRFFSLEEINRARKARSTRGSGPGPTGGRCCGWPPCCGRGPDGNDAVDRFYAAAGRALHEEGRKVHLPAGAAAALEAADLDPAVRRRGPRRPDDP